MIEFAGKKDSESIVALWQEAFGDSREWVLMYLGENIDNVLVYRENGKVMGMLSLLPVSYKGKKGFYIYGVATGEKYRGKGVSSALLGYAKEMVAEKIADFLVLVPRNQGLFEFYAGRGFFAKHCTRTDVYQRDELENFGCDIVVLRTDASGYFDIRKKHCENLVEWDRDMLASIRKFENGEFFASGSGEGAFCYAYDGTLYVKELCGGLELAAAINRVYNCERIAVTRKSEAEMPSCMVYPDFARDLFFNISID